MHTDTPSSARRLARRALAALVIAPLLAAVAAPAVSAGWTESQIVPSNFLARPSLAVDGTGVASVAFQRYGTDPGIFVTTDAWGSPATTRVSSGLDLVPTLVLDGSGKRHIAFTRFTGELGVYYATDATGSWVVTRAFADTAGPASIALDQQGKVHIAYQSDSFNPGIYEVTNATGTWVRSRVSVAAHDAWPSIGVDGTGAVKVAFARYAPEGPGIFLATRTGTAWSTTRLTTHFDDTPVLRIDAANKVHLAWKRIQHTSGTTGGDGIMYADNETGSFVVRPISNENRDTAPALALGPSGFVAVAFARWDVMDTPAGYGIAIYRRQGGTWIDPVGWDLTSSQGDGGPSIAATSATEIAVAFSRFSGSDAAIRAYSQAGGWTSVAHSDMNMTPDLDLDTADRDHLAYLHFGDLAESAVRYGLGDAGTWTIEDVRPWATAALPRIAVASDGTPHVIVGDADWNLFSTSRASVRTPGGWVEEWSGDGAVPDIGVGPSDVQVVTQEQYELGYHAGSGGPWSDESPYGGAPGKSPSIAIDSTGKAHIAFTTPDGGMNNESTIRYATNVTGYWVDHDFGMAAEFGRPAIALDASGKVHIAYRRAAGGGGIGYVTNATGVWTTRTVTRSWADQDPSIAVDAAGKVYIVVPRAYWGANPGVYLATNQTGTWTQARISTRDDIEAVSARVASDGSLRIVVEESLTALAMLEETTTTAVAPAGIPARALPFVDLPGVDLPGVDLPGVELPGVPAPLADASRTP